MKKSLLKPNIIKKIMDRAISIDKGCGELCRTFTIMYSPLYKNTWVLRWLAIDLNNEEHPKQCFRYECFENDGTPRLCSIFYGDSEQANAFFDSLKPYYKQEFAIDHQLKL